MGASAVKSETSLERLLELYRRMFRVRRFEELVSRMYAAGEVPGFVHLSIGQEAAAVGSGAVLSEGDAITSNHRGHGHCIARGLDVTGMFAELMGRETGTCAGRGGSMHIADPVLGILGANGIVGAGLPIAAGAGLAHKLRRPGSVVLAYFGDGAVSQGAFHESINLAALWKLPVIFFCENNHYAEFSPASAQHPVDLATRAAGYGVPFVPVDGNDVLAVVETMAEVVARVRDGEGPVFVEADTYRWHGHYEGDPQRYRTQDELEEWKRLDPLVRAEQKLLAGGLEDAVLAAERSTIEAELQQAIDVARGQPEPSPDTVLRFVTVERSRPEEPDPPATSNETFRVMDAVHAALEYELETDERVVVAGIDVAAGNVFGLMKGFSERWPERVLDTPISETAIIGLGVGGAMSGLRPVVELMYLDFLGVCFDQIMNQAAKLPFMTGGRAEMGLTIRTQFGAGRSSGSQHSQSLEALLAHIPGLTVVMPSTPWETYGLLRSAIQDPNPVVFIEHRLLYGLKGPRPPRDTLVPLGRARVVRPGRHVTVVAYSRMLHEVLAVADELAQEGIDAEVIDLRTIAPIDFPTVIESVARTSRLVVVHEAVVSHGVGAEIVARIADEAFWHLDAPPRRVGALDAPAPYAPSLERAWFPGRERIRAAIVETVRA